MARHARNIVANVIYHVVHRGNNHQRIFVDMKDYKVLSSLIEVAKQKYPCKIYSFVFMLNHIHLLIEAIEKASNLSSFMKHIAQRYAQHFNKVYERSGTLWEGRYKSCAVATGEYLLNCSRYIEMNSMRASLVKNPEDYPYSSYSTKIGLAKIGWLDWDPEYLNIGGSPEERKTNYKKWFCTSISDNEWKDIREATQKEWAYGDSDFKRKMEKITGRTFALKKVGRKPKEIMAGNMNPSPISEI